MVESYLIVVAVLFFRLGFIISSRNYITNNGMVAFWYKVLEMLIYKNTIIDAYLHIWGDGDYIIRIFCDLWNNKRDKVFLV